MSGFAKFLRLCAGRVGQILNLQSLATDAGISQPTAKNWLSLLAASYIVFDDVKLGLKGGYGNTTLVVGVKFISILLFVTNHN